MSMMQQSRPMQAAAAAPQRQQQQQHQQQQHTIPPQQQQQPQQQHLVVEAQQQQQQQQQSYQFACLYTHQKTQKRKKWSDGRFVLNKFGHGKLYEACPALGSGNPCLAETQLAGPEVTAVLQRHQTTIEAEKYLIQLEGPWQEPTRLGGPASSSRSGPVVSTSMKKLMASKFRKPGAYKPPNPQQQQQQGMLGKRRRGPLQPGELVRQHYGDTAAVMPTTTTTHQLPTTNQLPSQMEPHRITHNQLPSAWDTPVNPPTTTLRGATTFVPRNSLVGQLQNQQQQLVHGQHNTVPQNSSNNMGAVASKNPYNRANGMPIRAQPQPQQPPSRNWFQAPTNPYATSQSQSHGMPNNQHHQPSSNPPPPPSFQHQQPQGGPPPPPPPRQGPPLAAGQVLQNAVPQQQQPGGPPRPPQRNEFVKNDFDPRNFYGLDEEEEDSSDDEDNRSSSNKENPPSTWQPGAGVPSFQQPQQPYTNTLQQKQQPEMNNGTSYNAGQQAQAILQPAKTQDRNTATSTANQVQQDDGGDTMTKEDLLDLFGESQTQDDDDDDDERGQTGQLTGNEDQLSGGGSTSAATTNEAATAVFGAGAPTTEAGEFTLPPLDDSSSDSSDDEDN